ncbi:MAG: hypothetical protein CFE33_15920 [Pseudorhodobacter sp. PARRP1]|nr:MAG: hypothetical protein CFE33_15920 [Pseudorhodobacter sp. PARRP1]
MIKDEDTVFDILEALPLIELRQQMKIGCRGIYFKLFGQDISEAQYDFSHPAESAAKELKWRHILRNSLVTTWKDSQNLRIDDTDDLFEEILMIGENLENSGYEDVESLALLSEFLKSA